MTIQLLQLLFNIGMITRDNLHSVLDSISTEDINKAFASHDDYILLTMNGYGYVYLECVPYSEESEQEAEDCGGVFNNKDANLH